MYPFLYQTETNGTLFRIPTYGLLVLLGFAAAFTLMNWRGRQMGIAPERLVPIYIASAVGGIIGARLLYAFAVEPMKTLTDPLSLISSAGGLAFYGGLLGGAVATLGVAAATKLPGWKLLDLMAPALMLGQGIGRFGCFFAGCCHGDRAPVGENPIALLPDGVLQGQIWFSKVFPFVTFQFDTTPMVRHELLHLPLYPTQLATAFYLLTLAGLGTALWSKRKFDGMIAGLILLIEPICRFLVESYRADERGYAISWAVDKVPAWLPPGFFSAGEVLPDGTHPGSVIGLTTSQGIGLAIVLVAVGILFAQRNKGVAEEIPLPEEA